MDPYIERPEIWPDFHDRLITYLCAALKPLLPPRYVALTQDRLFVVESDRPIRPDVSVIETRRGTEPHAGQATVVEVDAPAVFEFWREELKEPLVEIIEPAAGNRVVTAIEVLSPDNKVPGPGRDSYLRKRYELWEAATNLVEIDLLRQGGPTVRVAPEKLETLGPWQYLVSVTRRWPSREEIYAFPLQKRLPRIRLPLATADEDVRFDLQGAFARCWDEGPYPALLRYEAGAPGDLSDADRTWCDEQLRKAGFR